MAGAKAFVGFGSLSDILRKTAIEGTVLRSIQAGVAGSAASIDLLIIPKCHTTMIKGLMLGALVLDREGTLLTPIERQQLVFEMPVGYSWQSELAACSGSELTPHRNHRTSWN